MRHSKEVRIGNIAIGGNQPIAVQSMLNIPAEDIEGNVKQALRLEKAGCQIIRTAVPHLDNVPLICALKEVLHIPVVADIHFDYRIALACADAGVDKIRINPGNIGDDAKVKEVAEKCKQKEIPIRIGVNSGSLEKSILYKYGSPCAEALVESALYHASLLEKFDFNDIVISLKSSNVHTMIEAYTQLSRQCEYPLHLGVTEAGTKEMGIVKSSIGIGALLQQGIGDTIRVSLTADPVEEIYAANNILKALDLKQDEPYLISCPTCGRTKIDLISLASEVEARLKDVHKPIKVAVMGCVVNGPGEAREADIGIAGGDGEGLIFKKGKTIMKLPEEQLIDKLFEEIETL
ncbi:MAG: flavodoxin-dependent (E)-4-hydroxy-3-methylbut-2-enyl-diphosphate synthase [Clostridia bacterium]|nr:flavodoxin-dependent (E)-4-hydroxy-3-methylbut-2-enyl-diphosphate synthase [Clostridia bacterium]